MFSHGLMMASNSDDMDECDADLLLVLGELLAVPLQGGLDAAVGVEQVQHQLQAVAVHVHVQTVLQQVVHCADCIVSTVWIENCE